MGNPIIGWLLFAGLFFGSKQVPFHIPQIFLGIRIAYALSTILVLIIYSYTKGSIDKSRDKSILTYTEPSKDGKSTQVSVTVKEYDLKQWKVLVKGFCMSLLMMSVMHLYFKMPGPLLINMVLPLKNALESDLVQIHLFGKEVKRPFEAPKSLPALIAAGWGKVAGAKAVESGLKKE